MTHSSAVNASTAEAKGPNVIRPFDINVAEWKLSSSDVLQQHGGPAEEPGQRGKKLVYGFQDRPILRNLDSFTVRPGPGGADHRPPLESS